MKNYSNNIVKVYRRLVKYPPWALKRRPGPMKIRHKLEGGYAEYTAPEYVTVEDGEVLYAVLYLSQHGQTTLETTVIQNFKVAAITTYDYMIMKVLNTHNRERVLDSLKKLRQLTISYNFNNGARFITGLVHSIKYNPASGKISILFPHELWQAFIEKTLSINYIEYLSLSPASKNLYSFLCSNTGDIFTEDLLIERSCIEASRKDKSQNILKSALQDLVARHIIKSFFIFRCETKVRYVLIDRYMPQQ